MDSISMFISFIFQSSKQTYLKCHLELELKTYVIRVTSFSLKNLVAVNFTTTALIPLVRWLLFNI